MRRFSFLAIALAALVAAPTVAGRQQDPVAFRATADVVMVDVTVRSGRTAVTGLTPRDFVLLDNGVAQQIDGTTIEQVPVDLTLILDVSDSTSEYIEDFKARAQTINRMLRPGDRVRLLGVASEVTEVFPFRASGTPLPVESLRTRPGTSINDALLLSLVRAPDPGRRQLIVTFTDAIDTTSVSSASDVKTVAREARAVLHIALFGTSSEHDGAIQMLRAAAEATGGDMYAPETFGNAIDAFKQVFEDFRHSYVLRYVPHGVRAEGWHDLKVTLANPGDRRYTISARKGYVGGANK
jgi:VWFA-related protein